MFIDSEFGPSGYAKPLMIYQHLQKILGKGRVSQNKNISAYITLRTHTEAEFYFEARSREDLINAINEASTLKIPVLILGGGSNIAVFHEKLQGLIVRNQYHHTSIVEETEKTVDLFVSSGYPVGRLVKDTTEKGFEGFEYHLGLPGTVGGALYMNSKWTKPVSYFGDSLIAATLMDHTGAVKVVNRDYFDFAYDFSILHKTQEIVLDATFRLKKMEPSILQKRAKDALEYRKLTQPFGVATSGCFFRNISKEDQEKLNVPSTSAGYLIDHAGLKNKQVGDFIVSDKHANFIINKGTGTASDLVKLIGIIKDEVKGKYGVDLVEEVIKI